MFFLLEFVPIFAIDNTNINKIMKTNYLSIREVAKKLRVDYSVIRILVLGGKLKATKIGKQYRIAEEDLDDYMNINSTIRSQSNQCN